MTEFNYEKPAVLITLYYLRSIYLYLGNPPFLTLTLEPTFPVVHAEVVGVGEVEGGSEQR